MSFDDKIPCSGCYGLTSDTECHRLGDKTYCIDCAERRKLIPPRPLPTVADILKTVADFFRKADE
jgi:hypothetical protein